MMVDVRNWYFRVMDRLEEFEEHERRFIIFLAERDAEYGMKMRTWTNNHPLKHFKVGVVVKLHHLEAKKEWNDKKAIIIGEGVIKNDTFRWPIQLMDGSKSKALLRQHNLNHI